MARIWIQLSVLNVLGRLNVSSHPLPYGLTEYLHVLTSYLPIHSHNTVEQFSSHVIHWFQYTHIYIKLSITLYKYVYANSKAESTTKKNVWACKRFEFNFCHNLCASSCNSKSLYTTAKIKCFSIYSSKGLYRIYSNWCRRDWIA